MTIAVTVDVMMKTRPLALPAGRALAAVLALAATPALAQDATVTTGTDAVAPVPEAAEPVVVASQPATVEVPAPALDVVLPEAAVVDTAPASTEETAATDAPTAAARTSSAPSTPRIAPADPAPASTSEFNDLAFDAQVPVIDNAESAEGLSALSAAERVSDAPVSTSPAADQSGSGLVLAGGGLAVALGLAGLFMAGASRRRRAARSGAVMVPRSAPIQPRTDPVRPASVTPVAPATAVPVSRPGSALPSGFVISARNPAPSYASKWHSDGYVNASPAAGVSGRSVPNTPEGRKALIDRLVRARPDDTIPFTSASARRRRARLIVQSLQQKLAEQPNLDFRRFYESFGRRHPVTA